MSGHIYTRWIEIDLDAIVHNFYEVKKILPAGVKVLAVVKANAYGYGAKAVAAVLEEAGADMLAVTTLEEGRELVECGIKIPILVFAPLIPAQAEEYLQYGLLPTVDDPAALEALAGAAELVDTRCGFHLEIETGMGRTGLKTEELLSFIRSLKQLPRLELQGVFSHFATAMDADKSYAQKQFSAFMDAISTIKKEGISPGTAHICNSSAILDLPQMHLDMVRVGTLLYGQYPSDHVNKKLDLADPWKAKAVLIGIKKIAAGDSVGYGRDYIAHKPADIGIIPYGYADGFGMIPRTRPVKAGLIIKELAKNLLSFFRFRPAHYVLWGREKLPVVGRIGMQLSMIDISGQPMKIGDQVEVSLRRTTSSPLLPRVYYKKGKRLTDREIFCRILGEHRE